MEDTDIARGLPDAAPSDRFTVHVKGFEKLSQRVQRVQVQHGSLRLFVVECVDGKTLSELERLADHVTADVRVEVLLPDGTLLYTIKDDPHRFVDYELALDVSRSGRLTYEAILTRVVG